MREQQVTECILFNEKEKCAALHRGNSHSYFPKPGWVEHDADEIWAGMLGVAVEAMNMIGQKQRTLQQSVLRTRERDNHRLGQRDRRADPSCNRMAVP